LTVAARRPEKLAGAVEELRAKGFEVEEVAANLTSEEDIQRVVPEIVFQRPGETI
jgi:hypothetical protein